MSEDPIRFAAGDVNLQRYAANTPNNVVDFEGEQIRPNPGSRPSPSQTPSRGPRGQDRVNNPGQGGRKPGDKTPAPILNRNNLSQLEEDLLNGVEHTRGRAAREQAEQNLRLARLQEQFPQRYINEIGAARRAGVPEAEIQRALNEKYVTRPGSGGDPWREELQRLARAQQIPKPGEPDFVGPLAPRTPTEILMPNGTPIGTPGSSSGIRRIPGGLPAGQRIFDELSAGGTDITPPSYPGVRIQRPDGGVIGLRPVSSSRDKSPSIDVDIPGIPFRKIHCEP